VEVTRELPEIEKGKRSAIKKIDGCGFPFSFLRFFSFLLCKGGDFRGGFCFFLPFSFWLKGEKDLRESACGMANRDAVCNAIGYAKFYNRSQDALIRVYDDARQRD
jgi:hypothetical protein